MAKMPPSVAELDNSPWNDYMYEFCFLPPSTIRKNILTHLCYILYMERGKKNLMTFMTAERRPQHFSFSSSSFISFWIMQALITRICHNCLVEGERWTDAEKAEKEKTKFGSGAISLATGGCSAHSVKNASVWGGVCVYQTYLSQMVPSSKSLGLGHFIIYVFFFIFIFF